jgi:hypothetical protein
VASANDCKGRNGNAKVLDDLPGISMPTAGRAMRDDLKSP